MKKKILIGTPAYKSLVHVDYMNMIMGLNDKNIEFDILFSCDEPLIPRARNTIISYFYHNQDKYTHLLFLDNDIFVNPSDIIKMLQLDRDILSVPVKLKGSDDSGNSIYNIGRILNETNDDLLQVDKIGTSILLLSKAVINILVLDCQLNDSVYYLIKNPDIKDERYDIFKIGCIDNVYLSEDYWLSKNLMDIGFQLYICKDIKALHNDTFTF